MKIDQNIEKLTNAVLLGHAYTSKASEYESNIARIFGMNANGLVYMFNKSKALE